MELPGLLGPHRERLPEEEANKEEHRKCDGGRESQALNLESTWTQLFLMFWSHEQYIHMFFSLKPLVFITEGGSKWRGYMYTYGWFMLCFDRKQQNSVKQLSFDKNIN